MFILVVIALLMMIPIGMISAVVYERASYQRSAIAEVGQSWGGAVDISGPALIVPVEARWVQTITDDEGNETQKDMVTSRLPLVLLPEMLEINVDTQTQLRSRGIFEVPVYTADIEMRFDFNTDRLGQNLPERDVIMWNRASVALLLPSTRSFTGAARLTAGESSFDLEPGIPLGGHSGVRAMLGDPRELGVLELKMGLNGAQYFRVSPAGRLTTMSFTSDWPHPSFNGAFLPSEREISDEGFSARWEVPHIARDIPQISHDLEKVDDIVFGVSLFNPVNFYQKVTRSTKYGTLFVALTFLAVFLMEGLATKRIHPAQFVLIGAAQSVFFLLLLALSEQLGFSIAYTAASLATISLLAYYGFTGLGKRAWVLVAILAVLYAILYVLLQSADYALLIGSVLAFVAVAATMVFTRHEAWYGKAGASPPT